MDLAKRNTCKWLLEYYVRELWTLISNNKNVKFIIQSSLCLLANSSSDPHSCLYPLMFIVTIRWTYISIVLSDYYGLVEYLEL